jgi:hypothetical protein
MDWVAWAQSVHASPSRLLRFSPGTIDAGSWAEELGKSLPLEVSTVNCHPQHHSREGLWVLCVLEQEAEKYIRTCSQEELWSKPVGIPKSYYFWMCKE